MLEIKNEKTMQRLENYKESEIILPDMVKNLIDYFENVKYQTVIVGKISN